VEMSPVVAMKVCCSVLGAYILYSISYCDLVV
jgi:hypothetical protein